MEQKMCEYMELNNLIELENIEGIINKYGKSAGKERNRIKLIFDSEISEEYYIMYCENETITKFSKKDIHKVLQIESSWYLLKNGYIGSHMNDTIIYLHQYLMNLYGQGKGSTSIDHINRDKLDNRLCNLRYANASLQNSNMDKKQRQKTAQGLPEGITQSMLPKYVYYCTETINKNSTNSYVREFFRIEGHPNLNKKCVSSSKSTKVSIIDKLNEINTILQQLDFKKPFNLKNNFLNIFLLILLKEQKINLKLFMTEELMVKEKL